MSSVMFTALGQIRKIFQIMSKNIRTLQASIIDSVIQYYICTSSNTFACSMSINCIFMIEKKSVAQIVQYFILLNFFKLKSPFLIGQRDSIIKCLTTAYSFFSVSGCAFRSNSQLLFISEICSVWFIRCEVLSLVKSRLAKQCASFSLRNVLKWL